MQNMYSQFNLIKTTQIDQEITNMPIAQEINLT